MEEPEVGYSAPAEGGAASYSGQQETPVRIVGGEVVGFVAIEVPTDRPPRWRYRLNLPGSTYEWDYYSTTIKAAEACARAWKAHLEEVARKERTVYWRQKGLSTRTVNALVLGRVSNTEELAKMDPRELMAIPNFGRVSMQEVNQLLGRDHGARQSSITSMMVCIALNAAILKKLEDIGIIGSDPKKSDIIAAVPRLVDALWDRNMKVSPNGEVKEAENVGT